MSERQHNFKVGDLVRLVEKQSQHNFIFRPRGFPFGKIGLITEVSEAYRYPIAQPFFPYDEMLQEPPRSAYDYDFRWYYDDLISVLVEGRTYWVFVEELEQYDDEGT
jgi:hypothetical protein|tara:strand:- start:7 stop:327 length:321 start_codon:yes stop_codon:yes gene_type:complete